MNDYLEILFRFSQNNLFSPLFYLINLVYFILILVTDLVHIFQIFTSKWVSCHENQRSGILSRGVTTHLSLCRGGERYYVNVRFLRKICNYVITIDLFHANFSH